MALSLMLAATTPWSWERLVAARYRQADARALQRSAGLGRTHPGPRESPTHRRELAAEFGSRVRFSEELALVPESRRRGFARPVMTGIRFNVVGRHSRLDGANSKSRPGPARATP